MAGKSVFERAARRFAPDRRGNFGMMMALVVPVLVLGAGFGVNIAQVSNARSNLLASLDSAVTSTARDLTTGNIKGEAEIRASVERFLFANGTRSFSKADLLTLDSIAVNTTDRTVTAEASVVVNVAFPLFGVANQQKITTKSAAVYSDRKIEVAMMLDLTGSMKKTWSDDKLGDLQKAAKNAVSALLAYNKAGNTRVRIALVPYANAVNVGKSIAEASVFVERKMADRKQAPSSTDPTAVSVTRPDYCATERKGIYQYKDDGPTASMVNRDFLLDGHSNRPDYVPSVTCPAAAMVPLTASQTTLNAAIDSFVADGGTAGHIGIQWTWYMLSEKWANVVGASAAPAKTDPKKVGKYAILMTDGEFNLSYFDVTDALNAYNPLGKEKTRESATDLCAAMRKAGVEIFTIGFKLTDAKAKETLSSCASPDTGSIKHYFDTSTGKELDAAFQKIVENLERLALTR